MASSLKPRDRAVSIAVALSVALGVNVAALAPLSGLSLDFLFLLRHRLVPTAAEPASAPAAIVAIDEETYRTPPFNRLPNALWTREIATVLDALIAANASVVGFDVIFPTSVEELLPGFDRDFLISLRNAARVGKVVLGEVQHQEYPIHPFPAQAFAVNGSHNIRSVNLFADSDQVIRRIPLMLDRDDGHGGAMQEPSMALELAARVTGTTPQRRQDGRLGLGDFAIPGSERNAMLINFSEPDGIPTYSFADLQACAAAGESAFFRTHFANKVVLIGAVLDVEDRKLTSARFVTKPEHPALGERCRNPPMQRLFRSDVVRDTTPGVFVLANGVDNLLRRNALDELSVSIQWAIVAMASLAAAATAMRASAHISGPLVAIGSLAWVAGCVIFFRYGVAVPLIPPVIAAWATLALLLGYRFAVTDRDKRLLRSSFGRYLDPALVDRLIESGRVPELGGEKREVTLLFSDLAGFTSISERLEPGALAHLMNVYLTSMTEIIEAEDGYVDKYLGDGIMAIFGAPLPNAGHALSAVRAALNCVKRLNKLNAGPNAFGGKQLAMRIGLASGEAIVGNMGSVQRFNYTAMGDVVNLASRIETANKVYGTAILAAASTRNDVGDEMAWREIDQVYVPGRDRPVTIFEPLALDDTVSVAERDQNSAYCAGLTEYRAGRFARALELFESIADSDPPSRVFAARARMLLANPPGEDWDSATALQK